MKKCFLTDQSPRHLKVHRDCYINAFLMWFYAVPRMTPAYLQIYFSVIGDIRQLVYEMNWFQYLWHRWYSWFRVGIENLRGSWRGSQGHRVYVPPPFRKKIKELKSSSLNLVHTSAQWFVLLKLHMYIAAIGNWGLKRALLTSKSLSFCLSCITTCQVQDWLICSRVRCVMSHQCWDSSTTAVKRWWTVGGWFSHQIGQKMDFYCIYTCKPTAGGSLS